MANRATKVVVASVVGFLATFGLILLYWASGFEQSDCSGDECALEFAAVTTGAVIAGAVVGTTCGFVIYTLTGRRNRSGSG
jgi:hypothetical protein